MNLHDDVTDYLRSGRCVLEPVIRTDGEAIVFDLSTGSRVDGHDIESLDVEALSGLIDEQMARAGTGFAFGRYGEPRGLYNNENFIDTDAGEARTIHLGIDVFCAAGTAVHAPLAGEVETRRTERHGTWLWPDDGSAPQRRPAGVFHLVRDTSAKTPSSGVADGQSIAAGEQIASVGAPPGNGNWPPHLHMQLILDLAGLGGDFPGVAAPSRQDYWCALSPSPAVVLSPRLARQNWSTDDTAHWLPRFTIRTSRRSVGPVPGRALRARGTVHIPGLRPLSRAQPAREGAHGHYRIGRRADRFHADHRLPGKSGREIAHARRSRGVRRCIARRRHRTRRRRESGAIDL